MDSATIGKSDSGQPFVLQYRLSDDDFYALNARVRHVLNLPGWVVGLITRLFMLVPFLFALLGGGDPAAIITAGVIGLIGFAGFPSLMRYSTRRRARAMYKPSQLDIRLVAEDRSIRLEGGENSSTISWNSIERSEETKAHFFLFLTRLQAVVVPKRAFVDESSTNRFRQMISERVQDFVLVGRS